jgi:hypothetical protein
LIERLDIGKNAATTYIKNLTYSLFMINALGYAMKHLVEELRCQAEESVFNPRWSHWNFSLT